MHVVHVVHVCCIALLTRFRTVQDDFVLLNQTVKQGHVGCHVNHVTAAVLSCPWVDIVAFADNLGHGALGTIFGAIC